MADDFSLCMVSNTRMAARAVTRRYDGYLRGHGVTATQVSLMGAIRMLPGSTVSELAEQRGFDRTTLTRNLGRLEVMGVVKLSHAAHGNGRLPRLTAKGEALLEDVLPLWRKAQAELKAELSEAGFKSPCASSAVSLPPDPISTIFPLELSMSPDTDPIVITGMGAVSPLGVGVATNWRRLIAGQSGIVPNTRFDVTDFAAKIAGLVPAKTDDPEGFDPHDFIDGKDIKKMDLFIQYGLGAAAEAIRQSGWVADTPEKQAVTATIIGSGVGGSPVMAEATKTIIEKGPRRLSPFTVPSFLANLAAGWISILYGFKGPIGAPVTACAASAQAIGDGMRLIRTGEAEVVVCGGAEGSVDPISIGGFAASRALNTSYNDDPQGRIAPVRQGPCRVRAIGGRGGRRHRTAEPCAGARRDATGHCRGLWHLRRRLSSDVRFARWRGRQGIDGAGDPQCGADTR